MSAIHITICATVLSHIVVLESSSQLSMMVLMTCLSLAGVFFIVIRYGTNSFDWYALYTYLLAAAVGCFLFYYSGGSLHNSGPTFLLGVILYILGVAFYVRDSMPWYHTAWHVCVLFASSLHMWGIHRALN